LGQRRGWALTIQAFLLIFIATFLVADPADSLLITAIVILNVSFCAAIQDTIVDAYRIERAKTEKELSIASTFGVTGFRLGMLISSTGALYISKIISWHYVYLSVFFLILIGPIIILYSAEPAKNQHTIKHLISFKKYLEVIKESVLLLKQKHPKWIFIILFIFLYKASDSIPMAMSSPLFINLSFTSEEIASISKAYGLLIMIIGGVISGVLTAKIGIFQSILICGSLQLLSPLMFALLSTVGHDIFVFIAAITIQNLCAGLAGTALLIYFSTLCSSKLVGTQFAIISSIVSLALIILSTLSGFCATYVEWPQFFLYNAALSLMFIPIFLLIKFDRNKES
jgi:MFS family permease